MPDHVIVPGWWGNLRPVTFGFEICEPGHSFGPAVRSHYLVHYVLEGCGEFVKGDEIYSVKKGDMFVIIPGEVTTYRADIQDPWQYAWIGFTAESPPECLSGPVLRQPPVRHVFRDLRDNIHREDMEGKVYSLLYDMIWSLSERKNRVAQEPKGYTAYAKAYLDNNYMCNVRIADLADSLHIDRRYLTALFHRAYAMSPQAYLMQRRLMHAREFLKDGSTVGEAAAMSGFTDLSNFSRRYKDFFGLCPSQEKAGD